MEMTFRKEATERHIAFAEIAKETTLPLEQVELLVMKALSQGLVRGKIDEVEQVVMLTWVQPRVLDRQQLNTMTNKIQSWSTSVQSMNDTAGSGSRAALYRIVETANVVLA